MMQTLHKRTRANFLRFFSYAGKYKFVISLAMICGCIRYLIPLVLPWSIKILVDDFLGPSTTRASRDLHFMMGGLCGLYVVYGVISYFRSYLAGLAGNRIVFDLRRDLYLYLQRMSLSFFDRRRVGEVVNRMTADISSAHHIVGSALVTTSMDLVLVGVVLTLLFLAHWKLAVISLSVIPFYIFTNYFLTKQIRQKSAEIYRVNEEISGELHEQFAAISTIQAFAQEESEARQFRQRSKLHLSAVLSSLHLQSIALGITGFLTAIGPILVLWYGTAEVWGGRLSVGSLMAFYAYLGMLYQPIQRLTELNFVLTNSLAAIDRIFEIFDTYPEVHEKPNAVSMEKIQGTVTFKNVSFAYEGRAEVYSHFSAVIPEGTTVALVGPSGAGKSTLAKLILRFYDPQEGSIMIDSKDIRAFTLKSLRQNVAFVAQDPILLSGTILENLRYGRPNASLAEVKAAAHAASADAFIEAMPDGYESEIGERGVKLSGGEKQRLAIARAFLKDSPILIMDEPTSSLDAKSEELIKKALTGLLWHRTAIVIAHRLSTIEHADQILVMDRGAIIEQGKHQDLIKNEKGLYRQYLRSQITFYGAGA
ncbi:MAG: ABC transporter ATP-binding protein [Candidatus Omnitrophota bacterium]|nr:ABC transporter ATP-binding protein [Candidatus Omnitrophota bacterium]